MRCDYDTQASRLMAEATEETNAERGSHTQTQYLPLRHRRQLHKPYGRPGKMPVIYYILRVKKMAQCWYEWGTSMMDESVGICDALKQETKGWGESQAIVDAMWGDVNAVLTGKWIATGKVKLCGHCTV